jgi:hypothetical protein
MQGLKIFGAALMALPIAGAPAAGVASARSALDSGYTRQAVVTGVTLPQPELGRCLKLSGEKVGKKSVYHGGYKNGSCTNPSATEQGKYEWLPGPGAHPQFRDTVGKLIAKTVGRSGTYTCLAGAGEGEYLGVSDSTGATTYIGCALEVPPVSASCQDFGASSGVVTTKTLEGALGFIKRGARPSVGVDLKPASGQYLLIYECGGVELLEEGSVIAPITPTDTMTSTFTAKYSEVGGRQIPEEFAGGTQDVLIAVIPTLPPPEQAGVEATVVDTTDEPLEIRAKA